MADKLPCGTWVMTFGANQCVFFLMFLLCMLFLWFYYDLQSARLLCPWDFPGKNTGVGCHSFLQGIVLTQRLNPHLLYLLHWHVGSLPSEPGDSLESITMNKASGGDGIPAELFQILQDDAVTVLHSICQ